MTTHDGAAVKARKETERELACLNLSYWTSQYNRSGPVLPVGCDFGAVVL